MSEKENEKEERKRGNTGTRGVGQGGSSGVWKCERDWRSGVGLSGLASWIGWREIANRVFEPFGCVDEFEKCGKVEFVS